ncbi:MAG TPA: hypothetical protein VLI72_02675 [Methylibium sp.]|nr:hypothetical protein [Methylibium sp.]
MSDDFFARPPFHAAEALATLKRSLRDLKLTEREGVFELRSQAVARLVLEGEGTIRAQLAKRLTRAPEWEARLLCSQADVRKFTDELKQRLARWSDRDD